MKKDISDQINLSDIIVTWFLFWVLTLTGVVLFAGCVLVPLWQEKMQLALEHQAVDRQVRELQKKVDQVNDQLAALWVDPDYTERIARSELNLRKTGEQTIAVQPVSILPDTPSTESETTITLPRDFSKAWWFHPFLDAQRRTWFMYLSGALVATGLIIAIAGKERRLRELGF